MRLLQLGHRADVAGAELVRMPHLLALRDEQLADALLRVRATVEHLRVGPQRALVDAEQVDPAGERIGERLEDERDDLAVGIGLERDLACLHTAGLDRRGQVFDERVEQPVGCEIAGSDAARDREQLAARHAVLQDSDDLLV